MIFWWSSEADRAQLEDRGTPLDLNLDTLKREILTYLEGRDYAVFRSAPGTLDGSQMVLWDAENYPDYQMFLEAASKVGVKLILFATREFTAEDIDFIVSTLRPKAGDHQCLTRDESEEDLQNEQNEENGWSPKPGLLNSFCHGMGITKPVHHRS